MNNNYYCEQHTCKDTHTFAVVELQILGSADRIGMLVCAVPRLNLLRKKYDQIMVMVLV